MIRYAIVDGTYLLGDASRLAVEGIDYIQLRAKRFPAGAILELAQVILDDLATVPGAPTKLLINARADIALAARAHGVHLTSARDELAPKEIRSLYSSTPCSPHRMPCISLSCHTLADIQRAVTLAPDFILFGPVFEKRARENGISGEVIHPGIGLAALEAAVLSAGNIPVLALGGVTNENTAACFTAGAAGIAGIRLFA